MPSINQHLLLCMVPHLGRDRLRIRKSLMLVACLGSLWGTSALGQACPEPWTSAQYAYGVVILSGNGTSTSGTITQRVNQNAWVGAKMLQPVAGTCSFMAIPLEGLGQMKSSAHVNDSLSDSTSGSIFTWTASGMGDDSGAQAMLSIIPESSQYGFGAWDAVTGTYTYGDNSSTEEIIWGAANTSGGATQQQLPLPAGIPLVWGTTTYSAPPFDSGQGGLLNANWNLSWIFAAVPDDNCKPCHENRGSDISTQDQSLGEDIPVAGTPFHLHYESSRAPGHAGADLVAVLDAHNLGGWTLSVHHAFEPLLQIYCAGGSCTPYAIVPKALFLGDGTSRNDADVQAAVPLNGNYYVTSEDGSEVYVFGPSGLHLQTLRPLTGALVYTFTYDSAKRLTKVTDANNNVTTIQRNAKGIPIAILAPFGQKTILAVDANGYLKQVTDPAGHITKLSNNHGL